MIKGLLAKPKFLVIVLGLIGLGFVVWSVGYLSVGPSDEMTPSITTPPFVNPPATPPSVTPPTVKPPVVNPPVVQPPVVKPPADHSNFFPPVIIKKPAVYLYPLEKTEVSVAVDLKGEIIKSEPDYHEGWKVIVEPSGLIDGKYDYLFYEARLNQLQLPKEGWVVGYKELGNWFDVNLKGLGLNEKEIFQFKEYWLSELPVAKYYEIKLLGDDFLRSDMNLVFDPRPTTVIRRNFYFKPLKSQIAVEEPNVITPDRKGFTVVEWGGLLGE